MSQETTQTIGVVLKCAVCLALLILLTVIGNFREQGTTTPEARKDTYHVTSAANEIG